MKARRVTFIALRMLSLYLLIRGIEQVIATIPTDGMFWQNFAASFVPIAAAGILWVSAESLAARLARIRPLSTAEVDEALSDDEPSTGDADSSTGSLSQELLPGALIVLGVFFVVSSLRAMAFDVGQAIFYWRQACDRTGGGSCSFFNTETLRDALSFASASVGLIGGIWLVSRPMGIPEKIERWRAKREQRLLEKYGDDEDAEI